ncbi:MAG: FkbM family methyltransferase [Pyrinomonadaceae bacterium]|nr:FkbM family methyltransferase [Pyrinomonadaceae bacterium]
MVGNLLTSRTVRRIVASSPRGRSRIARLISRRYPKAQVFNLVGPLARSAMYLDISDPFQADIAYGAYQSSVIDTILRLAKPEDVVLTAGAHLGYFALALAQAVGPTGKVLAFEADPRMVKVCRKNLELNGDETIQLVPVALGSKNAQLEMSISSTAGQSSFAIDHHHMEYERIAVRPGDEILGELGVTQIDGLVLDVEGWEMNVLTGLSKTLTNHLPRWAVIECWDVALRAAGSSADELLGELTKLGWETTAVDGGLVRDGVDIVCRRPTT